MKAMILAAGRGQRMAPLTDHCPKPLIPVNGKPLIHYHLEKLSKAGFKQVVINHAWLGEQIESSLGSGEKWGLEILYSREVTALETGGGICKALPILGDAPFLLVNGDVWTDFDYSRFNSYQLKAGDLGCLWLVDNPNHNPGGDFSINAGRVINRPEYTYSGISILHPELWHGKKVEHYPLAPMLREAMTSYRLAGEHLSAKWVDVGTPERLKILEGNLVKETQQMQESGTHDPLS